MVYLYTNGDGDLIKDESGNLMSGATSEDCCCDEIGTLDPCGVLDFPPSDVTATLSGIGGPEVSPGSCSGGSSCSPETDPYACEIPDGMSGYWDTPATDSDSVSWTSVSGTTATGCAYGGTGGAFLRSYNFVLTIAIICSTVEEINASYAVAEVRNATGSPVGRTYRSADYPTTYDWRGKTVTLNPTTASASCDCTSGGSIEAVFGT